MFYATNLSKRSLALDIKRGRDVLLRLVERADVFLQSLRPGTAKRLGYGSDELRDVNPRLVYCDIGAFGRVGPLRCSSGSARRSGSRSSRATRASRRIRIAWSGATS